MATVTLKNVAGADLNDPLELTINDRELLVLAGPSGCGSSTLVRLIAGLEDLTQGDIFFDERRINDLPATNRDLALLSGDYTPYPGLSVYENLAAGLKRRQFAANEIRKRVGAVAETLGLDNELRSNATSLSADKQRLVGLARALAAQPRVFLFDEPFANLSSAAASRGRAEIAKLNQRSSATIIYATSNPAEALALGARTVIIDRGRVQQDAAAETVYAQPGSLAVAEFFGSPPMNLVHGAVKLDREAVLFSEAGDGTIAFRFPASRLDAADLAGKPIVLGFRPEAVEIADSPENRSGTSFRALVERAEPKGAETDLYLRTGAHELVCRSRRWPARRGEGGHRLQFEIEVEKAHLFDGESGRLVTREP